MVLTETALAMLRSAIANSIVSARYKANGSYISTPITGIEVSLDGYVHVTFMMDAPVSGSVSITEAQLLNYSGQVLASKAETITCTAPQEGIFYRFSFFIQEL
jgi:hypothetical protein